MGKLFGTDGIRGVANVDITPELAFALGMAGAYVLTKEAKHSPRILIGVDTRLSGDLILAGLTAGMCSLGANVYVAGVIPTPGIAHLVRKYNFDAGVVISASHNSFEDNGIKFFNSEGYKLDDKIELEIEAVMDNGLDKLERATGTKIGRRHLSSNALQDYIDFLILTLNDLKLDGMKIAIDCANGATYKAAPKIFEQLGAEIFVMHNKPDGFNINKDCGSTHMESLQEFVIENKMDIGIAFDGDGDRCLLVDEKGKLIDGDEIMSMLCVDLKEKGELVNNTLVATIMSNLGLFIMGEKLDINIEKTNVGDRYVLEKMLEKGYILGGEQSGHVIFLKHNTTGDGILTALQIVALMKNKQKSLSKLNNVMQILPQVIINAKVDNNNKYKYIDDSIIKSEIDKLEVKFKGTGRVLVRASGTEALVRVMIEGIDESVLREDATKLAKLIEDRLA
jgi:phosphoglucosamine mutase